MSPVTARLASAGERGRLAGCLLLVIGVHLVLLLASARSAAPGDATPGPRTVQLRTIALPAKPANAVAVSAQWVASPRQADTHRQDSSHVAPAAQLTEPDVAAIPALIVREAAEPGAGFMALGADPNAQYLRRDALTVGPKPREPVVISFPSFAGETDHYAAEFELFIDDEGAVVRVDSTSADLPKILADAVRDAFLPVRFSPGEVDGRSVRSRIRIEVTFDSHRAPS